MRKNNSFNFGALNTENNDKYTSITFFIRDALIDSHRKNWSFNTSSDMLLPT